MSFPAKRIAPCVGCSAPAMHFISVLLPDPFGPINPWNSLSPTLRSTPFRAVSRPKSLVTPLTSSSGTVVPLAPMIGGLVRPSECADALALAHDQTDQSARPKQNHQ